MHEISLPDQTTPSSSDLSQFNQVFSLLTPQDIEQFQLLYQHWTLQQQIAATEQQIADVQRQLAENAAQIERVHPSAIALATLARLQASGVEDIDLLDRMLERGEAWLDRTIQQLAYCEQLDVIRGDYEEWCRHALEDAFAWIDSLQSADIASIPAPAPDTSEPPAPTVSDTPAGETTEELFLQKLMSEEPAETAQNDDDNDGSDISDGEKGGNNDESKGRASSTESKDDEAGQEQGRSAQGEEQGQPQAQEETAQRRSNFVQRFLSALWP